MASILEPVNFDPAAFRKELTEFGALLDANLNIAVATEICFDFDITGNFKADRF